MMALFAGFILAFICYKACKKRTETLIDVRSVVQYVMQSRTHGQ